MDSLWLFIIIWAATTAPIGPNVINCISRAQQHGLSHALWCIPGIGLAALCHISLGLAGLAALLKANPLLFDMVRVIGAGYMLYLAINMWRQRQQALESSVVTAPSAWQALSQAFTISITNPKAIFVNVAIFSQFIDAAIPLGSQLAVLIPLALLIDALIYGGYCVLGLGLKRLLASARHQRWFNRSTGGLYFAISLSLLAYRPG